jgi:histidyl-tRNA synthetase
MTESQSGGRRIKAQVLSGFRDQLPQQMVLRRTLIERFRRIFEAHGFEQIDTPALEHLEVLTGKAGENEKLMYHFVDHGDRPVGMRYDLTVPLARFVANHQNELAMPFKRYHIAPVWRAEKAQRGRFREFWQCDADIVGTDSPRADAEAIAMVAEILESAGLQDFTINISHRRLLEGIARQAGIAAEKAATVYRSIDKLAKIGRTKVEEELAGEGVDSGAASRLLELITSQGSNAELLASVRRTAEGDEQLARAIDNLSELFHFLEVMAPASNWFRLDFTLARGLDYYTGIVYEATVETPRVGSVSGGGRYDGLIGMFAGRDIPAMGVSIGLERIIEVAQEFDLVAAPRSVCDAIVIYQDDLFGYAFEVARDLRARGLNIDLSLLSRRSFGDQLRYADRRGIPAAVVIGDAEAERGQATVKALTTGHQETVPISDVADWIRATSPVASSPAAPQSTD